MERNTVLIKVGELEKEKKYMDALKAVQEEINCNPYSPDINELQAKKNELKKIANSNTRMNLGFILVAIIFVLSIIISLLCEAGKINISNNSVEILRYSMYISCIIIVWKLVGGKVYN